MQVLLTFQGVTPLRKTRNQLNMLGRYAFVLPDAIARGELRPLRNPTAPGDKFEEDLS